MTSKFKLGAVVAAIVVGALSAACTSAVDTDPLPSSAGTINYAYEQEFSAYNNDNANAVAVANTVVLNQVLPYLTYVDPHGRHQRATEYGTVEKLSDAPLTVRYTLSDKAVWSDGTPVTAKDFYLYWMSHNTRFPQFEAASTTGISDIRTPTDDPNGRTFTAVYSKPFGDWDMIMATQGSGLLPAHVIEKITHTSIPAAIRANDVAAIAKIADYWNNRWTGFSPGQLPPAAEIPAAGPYKIASWRAGQSITLVPNPKWWGKPASNGGITIRFIPQEQQVQALQNGDADVIEPQPNLDLIRSLDDLGSQVDRHTGAGFSYDHLDFNFKSKFGNAQLRRALALCTPRQEIIDKLIKPVDPSAQLMQTRLVYPVQPDYPDIAAKVVDDTYDSVDIAGARAAVKASGVTDLSVNAIYLGNPNQRRQQTMSLIADSCGKAGFRFSVRGLTPKEWGEVTTSGAYDVAQFAWSGSGLVSEDPPLFTTGSDYNYGKYSNPRTDVLLAKLVETSDPGTQVRLLTQIETLLWNDLATLPIFAWPLLNAYSPHIANVELNTTQTQATFNASSWERS